MIVADTLRRAFQRHDAFDYTMLIVEVLVLALIGGEIAYHIVRSFKIRRRKKRLLDDLRKGQLLLAKAPRSPIGREHPSREEMDAWIQLVHVWTIDTERRLRSYSTEALAAFIHDPGAILTPVALNDLHSYQHGTYISLQRYLNNLRDIIEKSDVYL
ncbi:hypothetical protein [Candidatus Binatus sp.]|uniref:hypothetical protein n=1 Tax=Candidatus Binatus sp. TaxID=2811406 RepID=UPI002F91DC26